MVVILIAFLMLAYGFWQNHGILVSSSDYYNPEIPDDFDNFKIVHISDLHNTLFGEEQRNLLGKVEALNPDIIVITGDLIDRRRFDLDVAMYFIDGAMKIAPVYYVAGNHEAWSGRWTEIAEHLTDAGVIIMNDLAGQISRGNSAIGIFGLSDSAFFTAEFEGRIKTWKIKECLNEWKDTEQFSILLSHRPELFDLYVEGNMDLIFAGHAHGGQFRIPFVGGLYAPNQGFFPKYTSGRYLNKDSTMFVSRGLGNSLMPIRLNNRPEIVEVTLTNKSKE
ncbi:metallophosphoesterase [Clostridia bacterium]|nr:metallophosphoesterase [Clostridia bacterium]